MKGLTVILAMNHNLRLSILALILTIKKGYLCIQEDPNGKGLSIYPYNVNVDQWLRQPSLYFIASIMIY